MGLALLTMLEEEQERRADEASSRRRKKRKKKSFLEAAPGLQLEFQLSKFEKVKVPQVQFLVKVLDIPVWHREGYSQCWLGSYCGSGSTYCVVIFFTVNSGHWLQPSTWHTARVGSDHYGTALFGCIGTCVHTFRAIPSLSLQRRWFLRCPGTHGLVLRFWWSSFTCCAEMVLQLHVRRFCW